MIRWIRRGGAPQLRPAVHPEQPPVRHANGNQPQPGEYLSIQKKYDELSGFRMKLAKVGTIYTQYNHFA